MAFCLIDWPLDYMGYMITSITEYLNRTDNKYKKLSSLSNIENFQDLIDDDLIEEYDECLGDVLSFESFFAIMKGMRHYFSGQHEDKLIVEENDTYKDLINKLEKAKRTLIDTATKDLTDFFKNCDDFRAYNLLKSYETTIESLRKNENMVLH